MQVQRRRLATVGTGAICAVAMSTVLLGATASVAAAASETDAVAAALETYRKGMLTADGKLLAALCTDPIAYGHSTGRVQTRKAFLDEAGNGKSVWKSIDFTDVSVQVNGANAMTRCVFGGMNEVNGKENTLKFGLLIVWVKRRGRWQLLARQGYKI